MRHKYGSVPTESHGIRFDSKREARYYENLLLRVRAGEIVVFLRQPTFHFPGGVTYSADFQEFWADGTVHFTDVKGWNVKKQAFYLTDAFKRNKKMVEELYAPIKIEVVA